jgi:hypothetical protein
MTPQPTDKLDTTTTVAVNGPADDLLLNERIVGHHATGPARACLSRMPGNWHVRCARDMTSSSGVRVPCGG